MTTDQRVAVADVPDRGRFEATVDGALAGTASYERRGDRIVLTHTEVDDAHKGRGAGSALARSALDTIRSRGDRVVPLCPFMADYIRDHDADADLVDEEMLARLTQ